MNRRIIALLFGVLPFLSCREPLPPPGAVIWSVSGSSAGTPAFDANTAYFLTRDHEVVALHKGTGVERWRQSTGIAGVETFGRTVLVVGDAIVVGDEDVHAFSRRSGERLWQFHPQDGYYPGVFDLATDGAMIFAGSPSGQVYAIRSDGTLAWKTNLTDNEEDLSAYGPVLVGQRVFVCIKRFSWPTTGGMAALDASTGAVIWRRDFPPRPPNNHGGCYGQAAVTGNVVVGVTDDGNVHAFDATTGSDAWSASQLAPDEVPFGNPEMDSRPVGAGQGKVILGSSTGVVVALDALSGEEQWRASPGEPASIIYPITIAGDVVYVINTGLDLFAMDILTGQVRWQNGFGSRMFTARPAIDGSRMYIGGPDHMSALRR